MLVVAGLGSASRAAERPEEARELLDVDSSPLSSSAAPASARGHGTAQQEEGPLSESPFAFGLGAESTEEPPSPTSGAGTLERLLFRRAGVRPSPTARSAAGRRPEDRDAQLSWGTLRRGCMAIAMVAAVTAVVALGAGAGRLGASSGGGAGAAAGAGRGAGPRLRPAGGLQAQGADTSAALTLMSKGAATVADLDECPHNVKLNDFSSQEAMQAAGWWFNWTDDFTFKPPIYRGFVPSESYWGFSMKGHAAITLRVTGAGVLTIDFGNLLGTPGSRVSVLLNLERKASAEASTLSTTAQIAFDKEDALSIIEDPRGIIVINSITFRCLEPKNEDMQASSEVQEAEEHWKTEYTALQREALLAKRKGKEHYAALQRKRAAEDLVAEDHEQVAQLVQTAHEGSARAKLEAAQQHHDNQRLAEALEAMLSSGTEKARLQALMEQPTYPQGATEAEQLEQGALQEAMKEEALAKEVEAEAEKVGNRDEAEQGQILVEQAQSQERQEKKELVELQNVSARIRAMRRNETWARQQLKAAGEQEKKVAAQLTEARAREEQLELQEARAAQLVKRAMAQERKRVVQEEQEKEAKKKRKAAEAAEKAAKKKEGDSEEGPHLMKVSREDISIGDELIFKKSSEFEYPAQFRDYTPVTVIGVAGASEEVRVRFADGTTYDIMMDDLVREEGGAFTTTTLAPASAFEPPRPSLYCIALMLPFGYEPELLAAQQQRGVGLFACDDYTIFSNSSTLLDTGKPSPVSINLVHFSLSVPYGGKWHTALNTGIFNKIWGEVVKEGRYLDHDWVVKADGDTVFFPDRLIEVLQRGLPKGLEQQAAEERRRRLAFEEEGAIMEEEGGCNTCRLPGHTAESCAEHAMWLQEHEKLSCQEALTRISRDPPVDCGCKCNRLEACDLKEDKAWSTDGGLIRGVHLADAAEEGNLAKAPIYINNCRFGLHGPIEVLSAAAVTAYVTGLPKCEYLLDQPWGEDKYLDRCMLSLGVTRANVFGVLSETACGEEPAPCGGSDVAFHPFKKIEDYFACWAFANSYGHGPASQEAESALDAGGGGGGGNFV